MAASIQLLQSFLRRTRNWSLAILFALAPAAIAFAAPKKKAEPPKEPVYPLEYAVVIFLVILALAVVLRPGRRTELEDEIKLPFGPKA